MDPSQDSIHPAENPIDNVEDGRNDEDEAPVADPEGWMYHKCNLCQHKVCNVYAKKQPEDPEFIPSPHDCVFCNFHSQNLCVLKHLRPPHLLSPLRLSPTAPAPPTTSVKPPVFHALAESDLLVHIFQFMDLKMLTKSLPLVSRHFYALSHSPALWTSQHRFFYWRCDQPISGPLLPPSISSLSDLLSFLGLSLSPSDFETPDRDSAAACLTKIHFVTSYLRFYQSLCQDCMQRPGLVKPLVNLRLCDPCAEADRSRWLLASYKRAVEEFCLDPHDLARLKQQTPFGTWFLFSEAERASLAKYGSRQELAAERERRAQMFDDHHHNRHPRQRTQVVAKEETSSSVANPPRPFLTPVSSTSTGGSSSGENQRPPAPVLRPVQLSTILTPVSTPAQAGGPSQQRERPPRRNKQQKGPRDPKK